MRRAAAVALVVTGVIHAVLIPSYLEEAAYIGVLFGVGAVACAWSALALWHRDDVAAWVVGAAVCAGMGLGFVLSRTVGLPGFREAEWEPAGIASLVVEAAFLLAWIRWVLLRRRA